MVQSSRFEVRGSGFREVAVNRKPQTSNLEPRTPIAVHCADHDRRWRKGAGAMLVTYLGHSGFMLQAGGKTVLIDPWVTGSPVATMMADDLMPETILLSHAHNDHGVEDALNISKRTGATIISTF